MTLCFWQCYISLQQIIIIIIIIIIIDGCIQWLHWNWVIDDAAFSRSISQCKLNSSENSMSNPLEANQQTNQSQFTLTWTESFRWKFMVIAVWWQNVWYYLLMAKYMYNIVIPVDGTTYQLMANVLIVIPVYSKLYDKNKIPVGGTLYGTYKCITPAYGKVYGNTCWWQSVLKHLLMTRCLITDYHLLIWHCVWLCWWQGV